MYYRSFGAQKSNELWLISMPLSSHVLTHYTRVQTVNEFTEHTMKIHLKTSKMFSTEKKKTFLLIMKTSGHF
jgi:ADP-glucose pyrophosphorylase